MTEQSVEPQASRPGEYCECHPWNAAAVPGDVDYRPGPDWPPSLNELAASKRTDNSEGE